ncbi:MAG: hypothetical protein HDQ91_02105 [Desulfovibrio sp.]|nr:hypothetical protein [Desulfovibrio sp.]
MKTLALGLMPADASPQTHIAAGPWCFCGQESLFPDWARRFEFAPEPLADASRLPAAARAAQCLCAKLIPRAAALLCPSPDALPAAYWQILLTPWLIDLSSQLVERALRCMAMVEAWGENRLEVALLPFECDFAFRDEQDFTLRGALGIDYNHWLLSRLLETMWPEKWREIPLEPVHARPLPGPGLLDRSKRLMRRLALKLAFPRMKGMTFGQALRLSRALAHDCRTPDRAIDFEAAFACPKLPENIRLPENLDPLLLKSLPASLESLKHGPVKKTRTRARLRIASIVSHEDAHYRQELAYWRARGNRIGNCQHGGNYGLARVVCAAEMEEYSQDVFFTWGWKEHGQARGNFAPLPSLQLSAERGSWQGGENLIFTGAEMAAFPYRLDSRPTPLQFVNYRQAKADFFEALGPKLRARSLYRPYFPVPGTLADASWLLPQFPELTLCAGPLLPQIQRCRLLALDHHGTTLLEALAAGIPFVCYWNRDYWPLTPEGELLLDMFARAGIWQPGPEQAAAKVREIWEDPQAWQKSEPVRLARDLFAKHQALAAPDALRQWLGALEKI